MPSPESPAFVIAIVATYRRSALLGRLLASLQSVQTRLAVLVVDNADDPDTEAVICAMKGPLEVTRLLPGSNLGCGGGLAYGERAALERHPEATHFWILDDDAVVSPRALELMLAAMKTEGAASACPTILDERGHNHWIPGLLSPRNFRVLKTRCTKDAYLAQCGPAPVRFSWAAGISLLVTRQAFERLGPHREDFWIRGDDIEFSLRYTYQDAGVFVPEAVVSHLPPSATASPQAFKAERKKEMSMLRNHAYIAFHLPHGRRILNKLPGNLWRFIMAFGPWSLWDALKSIWQGGALKLPAGAEPRIF